MSPQRALGTSKEPVPWHLLHCHKHQQLPLGLGPEAGNGKCKNYPLQQAGKEISQLGNTLMSVHVHVQMSSNLKGQEIAE